MIKGRINKGGYFEKNRAGYVLLFSLILFWIITISFITVCVSAGIFFSVHPTPQANSRSNAHKKTVLFMSKPPY